MILYQIVGILLLSGAITFSSLTEKPQSNFTGDQNEMGQPAVLGMHSVRQPSDQSIFPKEYFFGSGANDSWQEIVDKQGIVLYPEDKTSVFPDPRLGLGFALEITRALPIKIIDAGQENTVRTFQTTVEALLEEKKIALGDKDKIEPASDSALTKDAKIVIVRVQETEVKETRPIAFKTIYQDDANLEKGLTRLVQTGEKGKKTLTFLSRREDGREVSKTLLKTDMILEPMDEIINRGTKEVVYGTGVATWFSAPAMTAAHNSLARGTMVEVTNLSNGKKVTVKIIGGGIQGKAIIDLSPDAFSRLAPLGAGIINVKIAKP